MKNGLRVVILLSSVVFVFSVRSLLSMEQAPLQSANTVEEKNQLLQLAEARIGQVKKYLSERWLGSKAQEHARKAIAFLGLIKKTLKDSAVTKNYQEVVNRYIDLITEQVRLAESAAEMQQEAVTVTEVGVENQRGVDPLLLQQVIRDLEVLRERIETIKPLTTLRWQGRQAQQYAFQALDAFHRAEVAVNTRPNHFERFFASYAQRANEYIQNATIKAASELPDILQMEAELRRQRERRDQRRQAAQNQEEASYQQQGDNDDQYQRERMPVSAEGISPLDVAYADLGISRADRGNIGEIKKSYRKLARENHPDKVGNTEKAVERMQRINAAYALLQKVLHF